MRWKRIGKIFDPTQYELPNNCKEFAQSPQVLIFDDFVRVYFSTRESDSSGKYISHIAYVDFNKTLDSVLRVSQKPVISRGGIGCFDEHGIFPLNILKANGKLFGYIGGWSRRVSVSVDGSIGLAFSIDDGETFERHGNGPILTSSINEPFLVGDPFVKIYDNVYHMWYIFGTKWDVFSSREAPDRVYKIGHAVSQDGVTWEKTQDGKQIVEDSLGQNESQALPTMIKIDNSYHMFFCYRESFDFRLNAKRGYRIGHAYSDDLVNWVRDDDSLGLNSIDGEWDSAMMCYPHVFQLNGDIFLMYNGNEFGRNGFGIAKLEK
jgi:predicted GH43/DUF377 family glycosyl hydrolase